MVMRSYVGRNIASSGNRISHQAFKNRKIHTSLRVHLVSRQLSTDSVSHIMNTAIFSFLTLNAKMPKMEKLARAPS